MIVLGLDPSLTGYGWCLIDTEKEGREQVLDYGVWKTTARTYMPRRYRILTDQLQELLENCEYKIDWIGIEHPPFGASYTPGLYALYMYTWEVVMNHRIGFVYFLPTQLKAFVRSILDDDGKMFKSDMKDAMNLLLNNEWKGRLNHNVADAYLTAYHAWRFRLLIKGEITEEDLTPKEAQAWTRTIRRRKTGKVDYVGALYQEDDKWYDLEHEKYDYLYK